MIPTIDIIALTIAYRFRSFYDIDSIDNTTDVVTIFPGHDDIRIDRLTIDSFTIFRQH